MHRCEYAERKVLLDLFLSANRLTVFPSSREVLAFLQCSPVPVLGLRNQSGTHLRNIRAGAHRLVPTACTVN